MAIEPIPVTFHAGAGPRPELVAAQRRRHGRPYRTIVQATALFALLGGGLGLYADEIAGFSRSWAGAGASAPASRPSVETAAPSFPVWRAPTTSALAKAAGEVLDGGGLDGVDFTPVASIPADSPRPRAFAPAERSPAYEGFRIVGGR